MVPYPANLNLQYQLILVPFWVAPSWPLLGGARTPCESLYLMSATRMVACGAEGAQCDRDAAHAALDRYHFGHGYGWPDTLAHPRTYTRFREMSTVAVPVLNAYFTTP